VSDIPDLVGSLVAEDTLAQASTPVRLDFPAAEARVARNSPYQAGLRRVEVPPFTLPVPNSFYAPF